MTRHTYELAASTCGFIGGFVLSLDALFAVRRARSERGKESVREAVEKAHGVYVDDHDKVLTSTYALQLLFARRNSGDRPDRFRPHNPRFLDGLDFEVVIPS